jgi:hypothetical protein
MAMNCETDRDSVFHHDGIVVKSSNCRCSEIPFIESFLNYPDIPCMALDAKEHHYS